MINYSIIPCHFYQLFALNGEKTRPQPLTFTITAIRRTVRTACEPEQGNFSSLPGVQRKEWNEGGMENCNCLGKRVQISGGLPSYATKSDKSLAGEPP